MKKSAFIIYWWDQITIFCIQVLPGYLQNPTIYNGVPCMCGLDFAGGDIILFFALQGLDLAFRKNQILLGQFFIKGLEPVIKAF